MYGYNHPMVTSERWESFTTQDHQTWNWLYQKQSEALNAHAAEQVIQGIKQLALGSKIPKFTELNTKLKKATGFSIIPVTGLIPEELFFHFLANRQFPSTCFIRGPHEREYLEAPDIFHDIFGHVPLLFDPQFADFMQFFGEKGLEALEHGFAKFMTTFYWFTIEFGLIQTAQGLRIYGAGLISSRAEAHYALTSSHPARVRFNLIRLMKTAYQTNHFQKTYFVLESFQQLFDALYSLQWTHLKEIAAHDAIIAEGTVLHPQELIST
jgi:phenylalanine-4-hydroxylase